MAINASYRPTGHNNITKLLLLTFKSKMAAGLTRVWENTYVLFWQFLLCWSLSIDFGSQGIHFFKII